MTTKEQPRSIRFPVRLWEAIDRDAQRCGRSAVKQMEVLLSEYYGLRQVELDYGRLSEMKGEPSIEQSPIVNGAQMYEKPETTFPLKKEEVQLRKRQRKIK